MVAEAWARWPAGDATVPEHCDCIGQRENFIEPMRDEDHRRVIGHDRPDRPEQALRGRLIDLEGQLQRPGIDTELTDAEMSLDYKQAFTERSSDAYERVIVDGIRGDQTLFVNSAEVLASWKVVQPVLEQWAQNDENLLFYAQGSSGPTT